MKKKFLIPIVAMASFSLFSCAGSGKGTAMESTSMSETDTMAGDTEMEAGAVAEAELSLTDAVAYDEMFADVADTRQYDLVSLARTSPNLSTFVRLIERAEIADVLSPDSKFTIFAPTNQAFASMPKAELERLMQPESKTELLKVLQLHILPNEVASTRFKNNQRIKAGEDRYINVNLDAATQEVTVGGATIVKPDIEASNGIIHVINGIIATTTDPGTSR